MEILALNITPDVMLSTGRVVRHTRISNGAQNAEIIGGPEMTHEEWKEYCALCLACAGVCRNDGSFHRTRERQSKDGGWAASLGRYTPAEAIDAFGI